MLEIEKTIRETVDALRMISTFLKDIVKNIERGIPLKMNHHITVNFIPHYANLVLKNLRKHPFDTYSQRQALENWMNYVLKLSKRLRAAK